MTEFVETLREFADKYHERNYDPSAFTDEELYTYIKAMNEMLSAFSIVFIKLKSEQYQRRIYNMHMEKR